MLQNTYSILRVHFKDKEIIDLFVVFVLKAIRYTLDMRMDLYAHSTIIMNFLRH